MEPDTSDSRPQRARNQGIVGDNNTVELTQVMHQLGPEQAAFCDSLLRVAEGTQTESTWDGLAHRFTTSIGLICKV